MSRTFWSTLAQDIRYGARRLRHSPLSTAIAVLTLALGIGATSAIFSVVNGVLLMPLPFPESDRLVGLYHTWKGSSEVMSPPNFLDLQSRAQSLSAAGAYDNGTYTLTNAGDPTRVIGAEVTAGFFDVLARPPLFGRTLNRTDNEPGHTSVVVLSEGLWRSRFGADPSIVNRAITLDGVATTVVGVMPATFDWPLKTELWVPAAYTSIYAHRSRGAWYLNAIGRMKPGVTVERVASEVATIGAALEKEYPADNEKVGMTAEPLLDSLVSDSKLAIEVLFGAVFFVLLIACVNVANLLLARSAARENEMAVRAALGAGRARLVRQLITECALLAFIGGAAGLALAWGATRAFAAAQITFLPRPGNITIDGRIVLFTLGLSIVTGLVFGLMPALQATRRSLANALRERGSSSGASTGGRRLRQALVVAEMALAVLLLSGAGLLIRSFVNLNNVDPGFVVGNAATFVLGLPDAGYSEDAKRVAFVDRATEALKALPGVTSVGTSLGIPPSSTRFVFSFEITGRPALSPGNQPSIQVRVADSSYFKTMGIPIVKGRAFSPQDRMGTQRVIVISESAVRRFFPNEDPLGKHITVGWKRGDHNVEGDIVGIVGDVKSFGLDRAAPPVLYAPYAQEPASSFAMVVRTATPATSMFGSIKSAIGSVDKDLPVARLETLETHVASSMAERRFYMVVLTIFASVALALAAIGIFGVLSYLVSQRTREIGIRVALGAGRRSVVSMIVGQALVLVGVGIAIGGVAALELGTYIRAMLFQLEPNDAATLGLVACGLALVGLLASWLPARRAVGIDPIVAIRAD